MASNSNPNQRHPLQQAPTAVGTTAGTSSTGGVGIGHSAPIRTIGGPPPTATLPGGMSTPTLVKKKLALSSLSAGSSSRQQQQQQHSTTMANNSAPFPLAPSPQVAYATRNPKGPLPPQRVRVPIPPQPQQPPPPPPAPPQYQKYASPLVGSNKNDNKNNNTNDPIAMSRLTPGTNHDPVVLARQSPGGTKKTPENSAQLQPHIVSLPPPTQTAFHPLDVAGVGSGGSSGTAPKQQQQQTYRTTEQDQSGIYQNYSQQQQQQQQQQQSMPATQQQHQFKHPPPSSTSYKQPSPPTQQTAHAPKPPSSPVKQRRPKPPSTPDEEVDEFLRGNDSDDDGAATTGPANHPKLRPTPLPTTSQSILSKAKMLASRRAWGDVLRVTYEALVGKEIGMHHCCYSELLAAAGNHSSGVGGGGFGGLLKPDAATVASGKDLDVLRKETCELMSLRFVSQMKLRRYADLGAEVASLGLMPHLPDRRLSPPESSNDGLLLATDDDHRVVGDNGGRGHVRAISGMSGILHDGTVVPPSPGTPGTFGTEASIDMLSSSPASSSSAKQGQGGEATAPFAWREGSVHPPESAVDGLPSWVPFGLRILAAHQLQYNDGSSNAIDVLYDLRDRSVRTEYWNMVGMEIWRPVIDNALVNAFVRKREWRLALTSLEDLMGGLEEGVDREVEQWCDGGSEGSVSNAASEVERTQAKEVIAAAAHVELLSRQLLILLQTGAIRAAEMVQDDVRLHAARVQSRVNSPPSDMRMLVRVSKEMALVRQAPRRLLVNEGLLLFARCKYTDASQYFRDALNQQRLDPVAPSLSHSSPSNPTPQGCPTWKDLTSPTLGFDVEPSLIVECLNNMSLCLLYSGHMRSAVQELEGLIREDPCRYLTEGVAFNLCTLYELGSDGEECTKKKKLLQRVAKRFYLHDVGMESFRLG